MDTNYKWQNCRAKFDTLILSHEISGRVAYERGYFIGKYEMTKIAVTDFNISYIIELFFRHQGLKRELFVVTKDWKENCFVDTKDWK